MRKYFVHVKMYLQTITALKGIGIKINPQMSLMIWMVSDPIVLEKYHAISH